jgi:hypothetical protein
MKTVDFIDAFRAVNSEKTAGDAPALQRPTMTKSNAAVVGRALRLPVVLAAVSDRRTAETGTIMRRSETAATRHTYHLWNAG